MIFVCASYTFLKAWMVVYLENLRQTGTLHSKKTKYYI